MSIEIYLLCALMFTLGQAAHLFLIKMPSLKKTTEAGNKKFLFKEWWDSDWTVIIGTQVLGVAMMVGMDEFLNWKPEVWAAIKWFFFFFGTTGSSIFMAKFSTYQKTATELLSVKSNTFEAIAGPATTVQEAVMKGTEATGKDVSINPPK